MDSNTSSFLLNSSTFHSVLYPHKEEHGLIDLGLSLRTVQPEAYHSSGDLVNLGGYDDLLDWPQSNLNLNMKNSRSVSENLIDEEIEGVQSNESSWAYNVKVNMDGFTIGRKICVLHHGDYSSLAIQLEDMFGSQCDCGLRLFQYGSEYSLYYKDKQEQWRIVGDVPWKEFVECVKRMRIARKN